jgi:hypothetical protein
MSPPEKNPITSLTMVREVVDDGVRSSSMGQRKDGTAVKAGYTYKYDGKEYPVTGAAYDRISARQIDANNSTAELRKTGGKYRVTAKMSV